MTKQFSNGLNLMAILAFLKGPVTNMGAERHRTPNPLFREGEEMKILLADRFPTFGMEALLGAGHECELKPDLDEDSLPDAIGNADILLVRSTKVTRSTIDHGAHLQLVIRAGAGTNTIDKQAAVSNAEYSLTLAQALDINFIPDELRVR